MPDRIAGLPLHPLVVHAVVVLVPLASLGVIVLALAPRLITRYGSLVVLGAFVAVGAIPVATHTGEVLKAALPSTPAIQSHSTAGHAMLYVGPPLFLAALALWWMGRRTARDAPLSRPVQIVVRVLSFLAAAVALAWVLKVGHSGAETLWKGVGAPPPSG
jgi:uncharacterized membrane protein